MSFFDIIRELRTGEPNSEKATRILKNVGWICLGVGIWNFGFPYFAPINDSSFKIPESYSFFALISMTLIGILFLLSSHQLRNKNRAGIRIGQIAILLLMLTVLGFFILMFGMTDFISKILPSKIFFLIIMCVVFLSIYISGVLCYSILTTPANQRKKLRGYAIWTRPPEDSTRGKVFLNRK